MPEPPGYPPLPPPLAPPAPEASRAPFPDVYRPGVPPFPPRPDVGQPNTGRGSEPPRGRVCFDPAETREKIVVHRLADPFRALRDGRLQGEALRARLCRWRPDEFIYEVALLLRDGRVVHIYMNAQNGQIVGALEPRH